MAFEIKRKRKAVGNNSHRRYTQGLVTEIETLKFVLYLVN